MKLNFSKEIVFIYVVLTNILAIYRKMVLMYNNLCHYSQGFQNQGEDRRNNRRR